MGCAELWAFSCLGRLVAGPCFCPRPLGGSVWSWSLGHAPFPVYVLVLLGMLWLNVVLLALLFGLGFFLLFDPGASWSWGSCLEVWPSVSSCWASLPRLTSFSLIVGLVLLSADFLSVLVVCSSCALVPHEKLGICTLLVFSCLCLPVVPVFGLLSMSCPFLSFLVLDPSGVSLLKRPLMFFQIFAFPVTW